MKTDKTILIELNQILGNELTAINQYFLHARMYGHWGFEALNAQDYRASIKAMKMADALIERILFLEGLPNLQQLGKLLIGETPQECLTCDIDLTKAHIDSLRHALRLVEIAQDFITREILADILSAKEEWVDWLETQVELINSVGLPNYLQTQLEK